MVAFKQVMSQDEMCIFFITKALPNKSVACILISEIQIQLIHVLNNLLHHDGFLADIYMGKLSCRKECRFFTRLFFSSVFHPYKSFSEMFVRQVIKTVVTLTSILQCVLKFHFIFSFTYLFRKHKYRFTNTSIQIQVIILN